MKSVLAAALVVTLVPAPAFADDDEEPDPESDEEPDPVEEEDKPLPPKPKNKDEFIKQDLSGHDQAGDNKSNLFEKDRFFVDKVDSKKTAKGTLVQGSLTSTTFGYMESGGNIADAVDTQSASQFSRYFTELRLQTDFRHIAGGKWDARSDIRGRLSADPGSSGNYVSGFVPGDNSSQSGFLGTNELEVRELWLFRSGKRSDIIFGRQFIADLAGVKVDGLRVDYASSEKLTFLGFGGLYPIRGSRSITTDYQPLISPDVDEATGTRPAAGRFTGAGGFGAAYRTQNAYGAFGGVALVPFAAEAPRIFGTATGYWRANPKVDLYHYLVLDLVGSNAVNAGLTNLSVGANFKPDQRLRGTVSFNRVDTETLNVQAHAFLQDPVAPIGGGNVIQNEAFLIRIAQNAARASLSAGLGSLQRFEITVASALRYRGDIALDDGNGMTITLPAGKSVEVYGSIVDRRSIKKLRIGFDGSRVFKLGGDTYQRTTSNVFRGFVGRELKNGHGEWEAEVSYAKSKDDNAGTACGAVPTCFGSATSSAIQLGGNVYYRFNRDWFGISSLFLSRQNVTSNNGGAGVADPPATGVSGFVRVAYRF